MFFNFNLMCALQISAKTAHIVNAKRGWSPYHCNRERKSSTKYDYYFWFNLGVFYRCTYTLLSLNVIFFVSLYLTFVERSWDRELFYIRIIFAINDRFEQLAKNIFVLCKISIYFTYQNCILIVLQIKILIETFLTFLLKALRVFSIIKLMLLYCAIEIYYD